MAGLAGRIYKARDTRTDDRQALSKEHAFTALALRDACHSFNNRP